MRVVRVRSLSFKEKEELEEMAEGRDGYEASRRARVILLSSSGYSSDHIGLTIPMHANHVRKWIKRFNESGIEGIKVKRKGGRPKEYGAGVEKKAIELVLEGRPEEGGTWTLEKLQKSLGGKPSLSTIRRMLQKGGYAGGRKSVSSSLETPISK